ncbi:hypothetical protein [Paenibacillus macquariensis]|uniref:Uncharacterized protein n=1 Tax=Paenibacillus macquariensis TaxID=948756 RepID=A0ABY1JRN6_9BACL|nr:hypothetical protein [Paenibacillus macquariensis]MEC0092789.1 hypothetical protein [Paenibacillus macquariensis]OAB36175.1 hypothetical protein PMSM_06895 [Paenibacillus macquariensis subsp. macquariensis]SIQ66259.1 hypothetical protein SAMN05421578_103236 [Paenibacillus macquariensis]
MHLLKKTRLQVGLATLLMVSVLGAYVAPVAQAEDNTTTIRAEWTDTNSGSTYYNWSSVENDQYLSKVIVSTNDGKWAQLDDKFTSINGYSKETTNPTLSNRLANISEGDLFYFLPLYLDTTQKVAVKGNLYDISPDGKWGKYETTDFGAGKSSDGKTAQYNQLHSYFLKNMTTGELQEWISSSQYVGLNWLADSTLLVNQYSPVAKQKAISTYDPATGKKKELVLGKLYRYSEKDQNFVFVKNEPKRLPWKYDLLTGKSRLLTKIEEEKIYEWDDTRPTTKAPNNLDIKTLPVIDLPIRNLYEHEVMTTQGSELVPYAFEKEGKTFIPLFSILSKFKLSVGQREGDMYDYRYKLTGPTGQVITLDHNNSRVFQFRLFVTPEVLEKVGLQEVTVKPLIPPVIK